MENKTEELEVQASEAEALTEEAEKEGANTQQLNVDSNTTSTDENVVCIATDATINIVEDNEVEQVEKKVEKSRFKKKKNEELTSLQMDIIAKTKKDSFFIECADVLRTIAISVFVLFILNAFVVKPVSVEGSSMYPTLHDGDYGFSYIFGALQGDFERFDVVIAKDKTDANKLLVKRIIALPGEHIEYKDDVLYIDGKAVDEPFFDPSFIDSQINEGDVFTSDFGPYQLGEDEYFIMGDNRPASYDSRQGGTYEASDFVSKYVFVVYPFSDFGMVSNNN